MEQPLMLHLTHSLTRPRPLLPCRRVLPMERAHPADDRDSDSRRRVRLQESERHACALPAVPRHQRGGPRARIDVGLSACSTARRWCMRRLTIRAYRR
jgi:hypothetical protein